MDFYWNFKENCFLPWKRIKFWKNVYLRKSALMIADDTIKSIAVD